MTTYQIALLIHLLALLAATAASAIIHLAAGRRGAAPTLRQSMEWARLMGKTARVFPFAVLTLIATGGYMVRGHWNWGLGWVQAGLLGALLLLVSGAVVGAREGRGARANVARMQQAGRELHNDFRPDRVSALLGEANTGLALAIVVAMSLKPGFAASVALLAAGWALGAYRALKHFRAGASAAKKPEAEAA